MIMIEILFVLRISITYYDYDAISTYVLVNEPKLVKYIQLHAYNTILQNLM